MRSSFKGSPKHALRIRGWGHKSTLNSQSNCAWRDVFRKWAQVQLTYWERTDGDVGWWNSERASISLLAAAIWQAGSNAAIQEYGDEKFLKGKRYRGRPDLYAAFSNAEFVIEAKQCWPMLPGQGTWKKRVRIAFKEAVTDASCAKQDWIPRVAVCFAAPRIHRNNTDHLPKLIEDFCAEDDFSECIPNGYRVDLFPVNSWTGFDLDACGWPEGDARRHYVGCSVLLGFID